MTNFTLVIISFKLKSKPKKFNLAYIIYLSEKK